MKSILCAKLYSSDIPKILTNITVLSQTQLKMLMFSTIIFLQFASQTLFRCSEK